MKEAIVSSTKVITIDLGGPQPSCTITFNTKGEPQKVHVKDLVGQPQLAKIITITMNVDVALKLFKKTIEEIERAGE